MPKRKRSRHRVIWRGKPLRIPVSAQARYVGAIGALVDRMIAETKKEIVTLWHKDFVQDHFDAVNGVATMDASVSSQTRILMNALKAKYDQLFGKLAMGLSPTMADDMNRASASGVRSSVGTMPDLKKEGRSLTIDIKKLDAPTKQILRSVTDKSADFIKSIPERHLNGVAEKVYTSITQGNGVGDVIEFLDKFGVTTRNWAHNTAMDQTRKAYNGLNAGRMKKIGIEKGEWIHSGGSQHPRELHEDFDGQTFDLNVGAPVGDYDGNDVMPGEEPNCRCTFSPVIVFDDDEEDEKDEGDGKKDEGED